MIPTSPVLVDLTEPKLGERQLSSCVGLETWTSLACATEFGDVSVLNLNESIPISSVAPLFISTCLDSR